MDPAFVTFESFCSRFEREEDCVRALFDAKWPDGFRCPRCSHHHAYRISTRRLPLYECSACSAQTSVIAGTLLEGSRTLLRFWFQAIFLHARPEGVNALQLSRIISVTYKTAWLICHKIRHAMRQQDSQEVLTGLVRITDARMCTQTTASSAWHQREQSVLVGSSENGNGEVYQIKIKKQNKQLLRHRYDSAPVEPFLREHVDRQAAEHAVVSRNFLTGKRNHVLLGIATEAQQAFARVFRGIGPKHLQIYLDQFCYVWNRRRQPMFQELLSGCAATPTITYPDLVGISRIHTHVLPRAGRPSNTIGFKAS